MIIKLVFLSMVNSVAFCGCWENSLKTDIDCLARLEQEGEELKLWNRQCAK